MRAEPSCAAEWAPIQAGGERQRRSIIQPRVGGALAAYPGKVTRNAPTPTGLHPAARAGRRQPFQGWRAHGPFPRVGGADAANPGLMDGTPLALADAAGTVEGTSLVLAEAAGTLEGTSLALAGAAGTLWHGAWPTVTNSVWMMKAVIAEAKPRRGYASASGGRASAMGGGGSAPGGWVFGMKVFAFALDGGASGGDGWASAMTFPASASTL